MWLRQAESTPLAGSDDACFYSFLFSSHSYTFGLIKVFQRNPSQLAGNGLCSDVSSFSFRQIVVSRFGPSLLIAVVSPIQTGILIGSYQYQWPILVGICVSLQILLGRSNRAGTYEVFPQMLSQEVFLLSTISNSKGFRCLDS